jgi:hypothetical protein
MQEYSKHLIWNDWDHWLKAVEAGFLFLTSFMLDISTI